MRLMVAAFLLSFIDRRKDSHMSVLDLFAAFNVGVVHDDVVCIFSKNGGKSLTVMRVPRILYLLNDVANADSSLLT